MSNGDAPRHNVAMRIRKENQQVALISRAYFSRDYGVGAIVHSDKFRTPPETIGA
jgi:hypothetical protein